MNSSPSVILAIESAICGGSISLLMDGIQVADWIGSSNVSKAEDLLFNIDAMLAANHISRDEIASIAVSAGPGSFTGIRIGIATALGLKTGLGIAMSSESALKAMAFAQPVGGKIVTALPVGRNAICVQSFDKIDREVIALDDPHAVTEDEFLSFVKSQNDAMVLLHAALYEKVGQSANITDFGANIAYAIGMVAHQNTGVAVAPLFISKSF